MEILVTPDAIEGTPGDDLAVSRALLERVASGSLDGALRIWRPVPAVSFSKVDMLSPGAGAALAVAEQAGIPFVQRMSGGHAVIAGPESLGVGVAEASQTFEATQERYERMSAAIVAALGALGVPAEPGALPGEWCPGTWSIHSGPVKLAGLSQRAIRGAAWTEAVIQLEPPADPALWEAVYAALQLPLDTRTLGGAGVAFGELAAELEARLGAPRP